MQGRKPGYYPYLSFPPGAESAGLKTPSPSGYFLPPQGALQPEPEALSFGRAEMTWKMANNKRFRILYEIWTRFVNPRFERWACGIASAEVLFSAWWHDGVGNR